MKENNNFQINKFWNFSNTEKERILGHDRILRIEGPIAEESWLDDEITPKQFKSELESGEGDITVWINSVGGCVFAASQIYNMLRDYQGKVKVKIDGIAASAASVIAMAGDEILMSPISLMMIHDPATIAVGDTEEMRKAISRLSEIKEAIINAYQEKSRLSRKRISDLMAAETWINAKKAVELGFADGILFERENEEEQENERIKNNKKEWRKNRGEGENNNSAWNNWDKSESLIFSRMAVTNKILDKLKLKREKNSEKNSGFEDKYSKLKLKNSEKDSEFEDVAKNSKLKENLKDKNDRLKENLENDQKQDKVFAESLYKRLDLILH